MSLQSAIDIITSNPGQSAVRIRAAASGMTAAAEAAVPGTHFFEDTRAVLDQLALAKAHLDIAAWHTPEVTTVTTEILGKAQAFVDAETIPCTEWPTPLELVQVIQAAANSVVAA